MQRRLDVRVGVAGIGLGSENGEGENPLLVHRTACGEARIPLVVDPSGDSEIAGELYISDIAGELYISDILNSRIEVDSLEDSVSIDIREEIL